MQIYLRNLEENKIMFTVIKEKNETSFKSFNIWLKTKFKKIIFLSSLNKLSNVLITKAELLQVGVFFVIHLFAREILSLKKFEIEETETT